MKNKIEQYVQFAINNGYKDFDGYKFDGIYEEYNVIDFRFIIDSKRTIQKIGLGITDLITSKEFIEAIAKGMTGNIKLYSRIRKQFEDDFKSADGMSYVEYVTIYQAKAIRNNNLEEFITDLLKDEK